MCVYVNEPSIMDALARDMMEANDRLGAALAFVYRQYPHIKEEVLEYMETWESSM